MGEYTLSPRFDRSRTWPLDTIERKEIQSMDTMELQGGQQTAVMTMDDEIDANPGAHFLSPVHTYEYEDWAEDSDSDSDDPRWDAGITDFALFGDDRRQAQETGTSLPSRWQGLVSNQASALQRSMDRTREDSHRSRPVQSCLTPSGVAQVDDVPDLTPDHSPYLGDDLEDSENHLQSRVVSRHHNQQVPRVVITTPEGTTGSSRYYEQSNEDGEDGSLIFCFPSLQKGSTTQYAPSKRPERPGLRKCRTLSGHAHVWKRPSMRTVAEEPDAEIAAEESTTRSFSHGSLQSKRL